MRRTIDRRRMERRIDEMAALHKRQDTLVREMVRLELREIYAYNPTPAEMILREGIMDFLKQTAEKAADFGRSIADDFKKGWSAFKAAVVPMLKEIGDDVVQKVVDFISRVGGTLRTLYEKAASYGKEKVRRFLEPFHGHHGDLAAEGHQIAEESKTNGCAEEVLKDIEDKSEDLNSKPESAVQLQVKEARLVAERIRRDSSSARRLTESRSLLREGADLFSLAILGFGGVMLLFKGLAALIKWIGGTCSVWATKAAAFCQKAYDAMHSFEQGTLDTVIPDVLAVGFYDFYIYCGFAPVEGDTGRTEKSTGDETFGTPGVQSSSGYKRGQLFGKLGSERDLTVEELEGNDTLRRAVKTRMYQIMLLYMLGSAVVTIAKSGLSVLYGVKSAVKSGEIGIAAAPEVAAAVRAAKAGA